MIQHDRYMSISPILGVRPVSLRTSFRPISRLQRQHAPARPWPAGLRGLKHRAARLGRTVCVENDVTTRAGRADR